MKKGLFSFLILTVFLAACHKYPANPSVQAKPSIVGKWNLDIVTTYLYDTTGILKNEQAYPAGPPNNSFRFQFNTDQSMVESMHLPNNTDYTASTATYLVTSDTTFTLFYPSAVAGKDAALCKIVSLINTSFVFSKEIATVVNGTEPGFIKYVYKLTKL